jgi:nucleoside phosphorylase
MGTVRAERAAARLLERACPSALIIAGFAAGLAAGQSPGDIVVATSVIDAGGGPVPGGSAPPTGPALSPDTLLLAAARRAGSGLPGFRMGPLATSSGLALSAGAKRDLAERLGSPIAVDMETAPAARVASGRRMPWIAIRAITDGPEHAMPVDFLRHLDDTTGEVSRASLARMAATAPWKVPGLVTLGRRAARAAGNLAAFIELLVQALDEQPDGCRP